MRTIVVGLGIQGNKRAAVAGSDLVATVDPIHEKANYKDLREVSLKSYDSALVCTPDAAKYEILNYLISNGKHVLVEKPLFFENEQQFLSLAALAAKNKVTCYTAYNHRFEPHIVRMKELIDSDKLGEIYLARFFYGNGTARDVKLSNWRDKGSGVLPDLGSHLLDTALFLFGDRLASSFQRYAFQNFENKSYDYIAFGSSTKPALQLEATLLSWRNTFGLDVFAENGSAHISCLCKWGPSTFTVRTRKLPSGKPSEESVVLECPDPTWKIEYDYFCEISKRGESNIQNDIWINSVLKGLEGN